MRLARRRNGFDYRKRRRCVVELTVTEGSPLRGYSAGVMAASVGVAPKGIGTPLIPALYPAKIALFGGATRGANGGPKLAPFAPPPDPAARLAPLSKPPPGVFGSALWRGRRLCAGRRGSSTVARADRRSPAGLSAAVHGYGTTRLGFSFADPRPPLRGYSASVVGSERLCGAQKGTRCPRPIGPFPLYPSHF